MMLLLLFNHNSYYKLPFSLVILVVLECKVYSGGRRAHRREALVGVDNPQEKPKSF